MSATGRRQARHTAARTRYERANSLMMQHRQRARAVIERHRLAVFNAGKRHNGALWRNNATYSRANRTYRGSGRFPCSTLSTSLHCTVPITPALSRHHGHHPPAWLTTLPVTNTSSLWGTFRLHQANCPPAVRPVSPQSATKRASNSPHPAFHQSQNPRPQLVAGCRTRTDQLAL